MLLLDLLFVESFILDDSSRWTIMRGFGLGSKTNPTSISNSRHFGLFYFPSHWIEQSTFWVVPGHYLHSDSSKNLTDLCNQNDVTSVQRLCSIVVQFHETRSYFSFNQHIGNVLLGQCTRSSVWCRWLYIAEYTRPLDRRRRACFSGWSIPTPDPPRPTLLATTLFSFALYLNTTMNLLWGSEHCNYPFKYSEEP